MKLFILFIIDAKYIVRARILVQVTIYLRLPIGRDGHLDQSEAYDISQLVHIRVATGVSRCLERSCFLLVEVPCIAAGHMEVLGCRIFEMFLRNCLF